MSKSYVQNFKNFVKFCSLSPLIIGISFLQSVLISSSIFYMPSIILMTITPYVSLGIKCILGGIFVNFILFVELTCYNLKYLNDFLQDNETSMQDDLGKNNSKIKPDYKDLKIVSVENDDSSLKTIGEDTQFDNDSAE